MSYVNNQIGHHKIWQSQNLQTVSNGSLSTVSRRGRSQLIIQPGNKLKKLPRFLTQIRRIKLVQDYPPPPGEEKNLPPSH